MEIEQLRQELNDLLENVVEHSNNYSGNRQIPSLEISYVLTKINKMQETLIILKHLLKEEERQIKKAKQQHRESEREEKLVAALKIEAIKAEQDDEEKAVVEEEIKAEPSLQEEAIETPQKDTPQSTNIEQLPISKLVDAFSLNDRYLYANELFGKDMSVFNEAVKNIDAANDFEEAKSILISLGSEKDWDLENEHVLAFANLVERRFL